MPQHLAAITYLVRDYDEAIAWFTGRLGFTLVEDTRPMLSHLKSLNISWLASESPASLVSISLNNSGIGAFERA